MSGNKDLKRKEYHCCSAYSMIKAFKQTHTEEIFQQEKFKVHAS